MQMCTMRTFCAHGEARESRGDSRLFVHIVHTLLHVGHSGPGNQNRVRNEQMAQPKKSQYISFRVTEEQLKTIESAATDAGAKARDWCREIVLEKVGQEWSMTKGERFLFEQFVRAQYLVTQGFQLLAENNLTAEEWKKFRAFATERTSEIADRALSIHAKRNGQRRM